jgi:Transcription elongation factor, GreA/GreB, C-term
MEPKPPFISLQSRVLVALIESSGEAEQREFTLVTSRQADFQSGLLDENTPLARALLGHAAGDVIPYIFGDLKEIRVLKVEPAGKEISAEGAKKRRAAVQKAAAQSEITNQMIFSTASGSKWGDYEVDMDKLFQPDEKNSSEEDKE